jgi:hypothetical protein
MAMHVHFVGSVSLESTADFFEAAGDTVKPFLKRCPDGEVGPRRNWINYQWPVFRSMPFLEPAKQQSLGAVAGMPPQLTLKEGTVPEAIRFGELGYAREARVSYQEFVAARERGSFEPGTRFQVCLPTPIAAVVAFAVPADLQAVLPAYEAAMVREIGRICSAIPHRDLAIQWDVAVEMIQWDGRFPGVPSPPNLPQIYAAAFERLGAAIPPGVELGFHFCYGDNDAKHLIEPLDLTKAVELANLVTASVKRSVNWLHMPVPIDRDDLAYFAPLKALNRAPETELFLGLVHAKGGVEGTLRRMKSARVFVDDFGIATECGMGRVRTPELTVEIMRIHAQAATAWSKDSSLGS